MQYLSHTKGFSTKGKTFKLNPSEDWWLGGYRPLIPPFYIRHRFSSLCPERYPILFGFDYGHISTWKRKTESGSHSSTYWLHRISEYKSVFYCVPFVYLHFYYTRVLLSRSTYGKLFCFVFSLLLLPRMKNKLSWSWIILLGWSELATSTFLRSFVILELRSTVLLTCENVGQACCMKWYII